MRTYVAQRQMLPPIALSMSASVGLRFCSSSATPFAVVQFQRSFAIPEMWSGILLLGLLGVLLALVFRAVERRALAWYHGLRRSRRAS